MSRVAKHSEVEGQRLWPRRAADRADHTELDATTRRTTRSRSRWAVFFWEEESSTKSAFVTIQ